MFEYAVMGLVGAGLLVLTSLISYELLRITWAKLPELTIHPRARALLMMLPIFAAHILCIWLYAAVIYVSANHTELGTLAGDALSREDGPNFLLCLYYSAMVYTTVGFGDTIPTSGLEMLAGVQALNGLVMIGWTVSFTYLAMEKFWDMPHRRSKN